MSAHTAVGLFAAIGFTIVACLFWWGFFAALKLDKAPPGVDAETIVDIGPSGEVGYTLPVCDDGYWLGRVIELPGAVGGTARVTVDGVTYHSPPGGFLRCRCNGRTWKVEAVP